jgi:hypothetical protein
MSPGTLKGRSETHLLWLNCGVCEAQPERFRQAGDYSYIFFPCKATPLLEDRSAECQPVAKGHCGRVRLPVYEYIFLHDPRAVAGVGRSWSGNLHLQVFLPRNESFNEDSFAECQRGLKPIGLVVDYDGMNIFFSTTIERWRIERFIFCQRNAPESHAPFYLRANRAGPGATERWLKSVSASSESLIGTNIRPTGNESVTQILTPQDMDTL